MKTQGDRRELATNRAVELLLEIRKGSYDTRRSQEIREEIGNLLDTAVNNEVSNIRTLFRGANQHDSQEFLLPLLDSVFGQQIKETRSVILDEEQFLDKFESRDPVEQNISQITLQITQDRTIVSNLFQDYGSGILIEGGLDFKHRITEQEVRKSAHLIKEVEPLEGVTEFPVMLSAVSYESDQNTKIHSAISLDTLTIKSKNYHPTSFIIHRGTSFNSGHYVTYIKEDCNGEEKWVLYNDAKRTESQQTLEEILQSEKDSHNGQPYVAKYSLESSNLPKPKRQGIENSRPGNRCWANSALIFASSFEDSLQKKIKREDRTSEAEETKEGLVPSQVRQE